MRDPLEDVGGAVDPRRGLARIAIVVIGLGMLVVARPGALSTVAVLGAIVLMIMLHELGHFIMAKRAGMKVTEYFLGFGPRIWSFQRGETEYGIKAIPLGGYVRIIGMNNIEEVDPEDEPRTYRAQPYRHRLGVAVAGSTVHFILAVVLGFVVLAFIGQAEQTSPPRIDTVLDELPAGKAGVLPGDEILALDGKPVRGWGEVIAYIRERPGREIVFTLRRDGKAVDVPVTPVADPEARDPARRGEGKVGIAVAFARDPLPIPSALRESASQSFELGRMSLSTLGRFFTPDGLSRYWDVVSEGKSRPDDTRFLSPIGAARVAGQAADSGLADVLNLLVAINVFVGVFNLVPLLPLDGGHVAVATFEKVASMVRRRRVVVDVRKLMPLTVAVLAVFIVLGVTSQYLDVVDPIPNPY